MDKILFFAYSPFICMGLLLLCVVIVIALLPRFLLDSTSLKSKKLLTANELEFLGRLRRALPGLEVLPQVSMAALLDVNLDENNAEYWTIRNHFSKKIIDYVVCEPKTLSVVAVVELDDRTHDSKKEKDAQRDAMLLAVGIRTLRWDSRSKPSVAEIASAVAALSNY